MHPVCDCWRQLCFPTSAQVCHPSYPVMVPNTFTVTGKGDFVSVCLPVVVFHCPPAQKPKRMGDITRIKQTSGAIPQNSICF